MPTRTFTRDVTVDVDIDLEDFTDDEIAQEFNSRALSGELSRDEFMQELRDMLRAGRHAEIAERVRAVINDEFGTCF